MSKRLALSTMFLLGSLGAVLAQSSIYFENFGLRPVVPQGWVVSRPGWVADSSTTNNSPIPQYSGDAHLTIRNFVATDTTTPPVGTYSLISRPVDASNYTNINVAWAARRTRNFATTQVLTLEASANGVNGPWTPITYTDRPADSQWGDVTGISLPATFDRASALCFKWTVTTLTASGTYRIDDFKVEGTLSVSLGDKFNKMVPIWRQDAGKVEIEFANPDRLVTNIKVLDLVGRVHLQTHVQGTEAVLDLDQLPKGIYWISLQQGTERVVRKIAIR